MIEPKYGEKYCCSFKYENKYTWYVSDLEFWYVDYEVAIHLILCMMSENVLRN